jgi:hypothetical protein
MIIGACHLLLGSFLVQMSLATKNSLQRPIKNDNFTKND